MILENEIKGVYLLSKAKDHIYLGRDSTEKYDVVGNDGDQVWRAEINGEINLVLETDVKVLLPYKNGFIYNAIEGDPVMYFDGKESKELLPKGSFFSSFQKRSREDGFFYSTRDELMKKTYYYMQANLEKRELQRWYQGESESAFLKYNIRHNYFHAYSKDDEGLLWEKASFEEYGEYVTYYESGELNFRAANRLSSVSLNSQHPNQVFLQLLTGELLNIDIQSGNQIWTNKMNGRGAGIIGIDDDVLYSSADYKITEIDINTGKTIRQKSFLEMGFPRNIGVTGPILINDDSILLMDSGGGQMRQIDRKTLTLVSSIDAECGFVYKSEMILGSHIYLIGLDGVLRIYKL